MTDNTNNIVMFPRERRDSPPQSMDELIEQVVTYRLEMGDELADILTNMVVGEVGRFSGSNVEEGELITDFLSETIKALYLNTAGIEHPILAIARAYFAEESEDDQEII